MPCEDCAIWEKSKVGGYPKDVNYDPKNLVPIYGICRPEILYVHKPNDPLPFWATKYIPDMFTQTHRVEGKECPSYIKLRWHA